MATETAARQLTNLLMIGAIRPGQFLSIREVSELVGAPIGNSREAVQQLAQAGFLSVYPNRGVQVTEITPRYVRSAFAYREIIESHAIRAFIEIASPLQIEALIASQHEALDAIRNMDEKEQLRIMIGVNENIHKAFVDCLDNVFASKHFEVTLSHINWMRANIKITSRRHAEVIDEHIAILEACRARDADLAVKLLHEHLDVALRLTLFS
jgi:DNA-binding GntR family transcriptional regulator